MLSLLPLMAAAALAAAPDCRPVANLGCYLERPGASTLLIYHRGWLTRPLPGDRLPYGSQAVPADRLPVSAADAVAQYDLASAAAALDASLLVTGDSKLSVSLDDPRVVAAGVHPASRLIVVAHSGGYFGLDDSLRALPRIDAVVLLDCFYGVDNKRLPSYALQIKSRIERDGTQCGGFYTAYNAGRFADPFQATLGVSALRCPAASYPDAQHEVDLPGKILEALRPKLPGPSAVPGAPKF